MNSDAKKAQNNVLKKIRQHYGTEMKVFIIKKLGHLLDIDANLLYEIIEKNFNKEKMLIDSIKSQGQQEAFMDYIIFLFKQAREDNENNNIKNIIKSPEELLDEAGYTIVKIKNINDFKQFEKYYAEGEMICTFGDKEGRLKEKDIYFIVKKDADKIERKENPDRDDEYGTSVMSVQICFGSRNISIITNRYNHGSGDDKIYSADNTYGKSLDKIAHGLTDSFNVYYGHNLVKDEESELVLNDYIKIPFKEGDYSEGYKLYGYTLSEVDGHLLSAERVYYGPNNVIIEKSYNNSYKVINLNEEKNGKKRLIDKYIIDYEKPITISKYMDNIGDAFIESIGKIKEIREKKLKVKEKIGEYVDTEIIIEIIPEEYELDPNKKIIIELDKNNQIIGYRNDYITEIGEGFLEHNTLLTKLDMPYLERMRENCLRNNNKIKKINLPSLIEPGIDSFFSSKKSNEIERNYIEKFIFLDNYYITRNEPIIISRLDGIRKDAFINSISNNGNIEKIYEVEKKSQTGDKYKEIHIVFEDKNKQEVIIKLNLENNIKAYYNENITEIEDDFLKQNTSMEEFIIPNVVTMGSNCLRNAKQVAKVDVSNLKEPGMASFMRHRKINELEDIENKNYNIFEDFYMTTNEPYNINSILFNEEYSDSFVKSINDSGKIKKIEKKEIVNSKNEKNTIITIVYEDKEKKDVEIKVNSNRQIIGYKNENVTEIGDDFLKLNNTLKEVYLPNVKIFGNNFLERNEVLEVLDIENAIEVKDNFLMCNLSIKNISYDNLEKIGKYFFFKNMKIENISLPKTKETGHSFASSVKKLDVLYMPSLISAGVNFLQEVRTAKKIDLSQVEELGDFALYGLDLKSQLYFNNLEKIGINTIFGNPYSEKYLNVNKDNIFIMDRYYIDIKGGTVKPLKYRRENSFIDSLGEYKEIKIVEKTEEEKKATNGKECFEVIITPQSEEEKDIIIKVNKKHKIIGYKNENVTKIGNICLYDSTSIREVELPNVTDVGNNFLSNIKYLKKLSMGNLQITRDSFLRSCKLVLEKELPSKFIKGGNFMKEDALLSKYAQYRMQFYKDLKGNDGKIKANERKGIKGKLLAMLKEYIRHNDYYYKDHDNDDDYFDYGL